MSKLHETEVCEVCGNRSLVEAIDLGMHPLCDDLISSDSKMTCDEYPIVVLFCDTCLTAHQKYQVEKRALFPESYHYRAKYTKDVQVGMKDLVAQTESEIKKVEGLKVLDIGCNDGSLLNYFKEKGAHTFGVEPTAAAFEAMEAGHSVIHDFFDNTVAQQFVETNGHPDIITFTNVFAHIEDLRGVISALRTLSNTDTYLMIENHYLGAILEKDQFDTFYHEHPRTYSLSSFQHIADSIGMAIVGFEFPERYGGNIRVVMSQASSRSGDLALRIDSACTAECDFTKKLQRLSNRVNIWRENKAKEIKALVAEHGPLYAKAFPGRSAIPIKLLGLTVNDIKCVYEKDGSAKIGHKVPGSNIPILADAEFPSESKRPLLNLAWHISTEIHGYMRSIGFAGPIIDIISEKDFEQ